MAAAATARNFLALVSGATLGELTCMEKLVQELVASKDINKVGAGSNSFVIHDTLDHNLLCGLSGKWKL